MPRCQRIVELYIFSSLILGMLLVAELVDQQPTTRRTRHKTPAESILWDFLHHRRVMHETVSEQNHQNHRQVGVLIPTSRNQQSLEPERDGKTPCDHRQTRKNKSLSYACQNVYINQGKYAVPRGVTCRSPHCAPQSCQSLVGRKQRF